MGSAAADDELVHPLDLLPQPCRRRVRVDQRRNRQVAPAAELEQFRRKAVGADEPRKERVPQTLRRDARQLEALREVRQIAVRVRPGHDELRARRELPPVIRELGDELGRGVEPAPRLLRLRRADHHRPARDVQILAHHALDVARALARPDRGGEPETTMRGERIAQPEIRVEIGQVLRPGHVAVWDLRQPRPAAGELERLVQRVRALAQRAAGEGAQTALALELEDLRDARRREAREGSVRVDALKEVAHVLALHVERRRRSDAGVHALAGALEEEVEGVAYYFGSAARRR